MGIPTRDHVRGIRHVVLRGPGLGRPAGGHPGALACALPGATGARRADLRNWGRRADRGSGQGQLRTVPGRRVLMLLRVGRRAGRGAVRRIGVGLLPVLAACYTSTPLALVAPASGTGVSLVFTDAGRVGAGPTLGGGLASIEGTLVRLTDTAFVVRV